jgi:predicted RNase H-like nuclease (RuvC/YqgF family)
MDELTNENTQLNELLTQYKEQNSSLKELLDAKQAQINTFQDRLMNLSKQVDQLGGSFLAQLSNPATMAKVNLELKAQLQERDTKIQALERKLASLSKQEDLKVTLTQATSAAALGQRKKDIDDIAKKLELIEEERLQEKLAYDADRQQLEQQHDKKVRDLQDLLERQVSQLNELTQERDSLEASLNKKTAQASELESSIESLQSEVRTLQGLAQNPNANNHAS